MEAYLYLEAHLKAIDPVADFTYGWCTAMGMEGEEAAQFALAVDELVTDMILFAYPDRGGYIEIWYRYSLPQLEIIIQESGEPFDPDNYTYSREKAIAEGDFTGAGLELVRRLTDHFLYLNRGRDGKEFRLAKQLSEKDYSDIKQFIASLQGEEEEEKSAENSTYTLRPVRKEDAEDIAKLIYQSYEYSYSKEDLYFPKQNKMAIEHGKKFGTMVQTADRRPVGYFTVIKAPDSLVGEVGEAVVSPPHRKRGLMKRMMNELIAMSRDRGLAGLYGLALTVHTISQKVNQAYGFHSTALLVAVTRGSRHKEFTEDYSHPKSILVDFLQLNRNWKPLVYLPQRYRMLLLKLYRQFDLTLNIMDESEYLPATRGRTNLNLKFTYKNKTARIVASNIGDRFIPSVKSMLRSLGEIELNGIYIDIPLQNSPTNEAVDWLHAQGFIFGGLMPLVHKEQDYLRMQKILVSVDFDRIKVYSEEAKALKKFIWEEYHALPQEQ